MFFVKDDKRMIRMENPDSAVRYVKHIGRRFKNGFREVTACVTDLTEGEALNRVPRAEPHLLARSVSISGLGKLHG